MNIQLYSQLIKDIYALCLDQEEHLTKVLNEFVILFQCRSVGLRIVRCENCQIIAEVNSTSSSPADELHPYAEHFSILQPHLNMSKEVQRQFKEGTVYLFSKPDFYPFGIDGDGLTSRLSDEPVFSLLFRQGGFLVVLVIEKKDGMAFSYATLARYSNMLLPHMHKAFEIYHALEKSRGYAIGLRQSLNHINSGLILFDRHMHVVYANQKAMEIQANHHLSFASDKIIAGCSQESQQLREMIQLAISRGERSDRDVGMMSLANGLALIAVPLHPQLLTLLDGETGLYAVLMIGDVQSLSEIEPEMLQLLYGLTQSEAKLAVCLSDGKSLDQCSEAHGISLNTARSYLKLIFQKTETSRQAELVARIKSIPVSNGRPHSGDSSVDSKG